MKRLQDIEVINKEFRETFSDKLKLTYVDGPLFVKSSDKINDSLSGESPVSFVPKHYPDLNLEVVHSLAKWKRDLLTQYKFRPGTGILTNMLAIRSEEIISPTHSLLVDQWDWEAVIDSPTKKTLHSYVTAIYSSIVSTFVSYNSLHKGRFMPKTITFLTSTDLAEKYPTLSPEEIERVVAKKYGAVFISNIGHEQTVCGRQYKHGNRAPDYDSWHMNGDIIVWHEPIDGPLELSSMGIRVDSKTMEEQISIHESMFGKFSRGKYHDDLANNRLLQTIGGGIGKSRLLMYILGEDHISKVQHSVFS